MISPRTWQNAVRLVALAALAAPMLAACSGGGNIGPKLKRSAFTSSEYGVAVSPRVTRKANPPKGGGRYLVGKPYTVRGQVYTPQENPQGYADAGQASWYGADFHGRRTANGEIFSANAITGAHPTLPLPSYVRVTNTDNGRSVVVRVNDRGPYIHGRIMDLSYRAAEILGYANRGTGNIAVSYIGPAPLNGDDTRMLMASINKPTRMEQQLGAGMSETRLAMVEPQQSAPTLDAAAAAEYKGQSRGSYSSSDLAQDFFGLFGYAATEEEAAINSAHAATMAMATRSTALQDWVASVDEDARDIKLQLGIFRDGIRAVEVAEAFAVFGAVDEGQIAIGDHAETRLTLTKLKPGVARADVLSLAQELGLSDIVLY
ncbi:MAG TPA: septal ring lytic transglycosylase RlpA family protein [Devosia sp.]